MTNFIRQYYYTVQGEQNNYSVTDAPLSVNCCGTEIITRSTAVLATERRDHYLIYMIDGTLEGRIADRSVTLNAGDLYCIPPDSFYDYRCTSDTSVKYYWVHFTGCDVKEALEAAHIVPLERKSVSVLTDAVELYKKLFTEYQLRQPHFRYRASLILRNILACFADRANSELSPAATLHTSISYIHAHISEQISIGELASMEFMSEGHYRTLFRSITGLSPHEYISRQRIDLACALLTNTSESIESVSQAIGIRDRLYFQRFFKKHTGVSPWRYRMGSR